MATDVLTRPVELPAAPVAEYVTDLPDGMTLDSLTKPPAADQHPGHVLDSSFEEVPAALEPEAKTEAEPPAAPPAPAPVAPEPKPAHTPAPPGVLRERARARHYKAQWDRAEAAREDAERRLEAERAKPAPAPQITFTPAERAELRRLANEKDTPGDIFDFVLDTVTGKVNATLARPAPAKTFAQIRADQVPLEEAFRADLATRGIDYNAVITKAGLWKAVSVNPLTNQFENPGVAQQVIGSKNWAQTLFGLAWGKLEHEGFFDSEDAASVEISGAPAAPASAPATAPARAPATSAAPPASPAAEALAEAERRGARRVVEEIGHTADRGRGIRSLPSAGGPPRAAFSRESLLDLMRRDYPTYLKLCQRDPRLNAWVIEGIPLDEP